MFQSHSRPNETGRWRWRSWGVGVLWLAFVPMALGGNGIEPTGNSMPASARGGADVAVGDTALSQIDNPATLSLYKAFRLDFSNELVFPQIHWSGPADSVNSEIPIVPLVNLGVAVPLSSRWTFGLAVNTKAGLLTRYHARHLLIPWEERQVGSDIKDLAFLANLSYKVTKKLSIGFGLREEMVTAKFGTVLGPADLDFGRGYAEGIGFQAGMHYQARKNLAFGLGYRSKVWFGDLAGGDGQASLLGILPLPLGRVKIEDLRGPQKVTAGVGWDVTDWCKLVGEVRWINYSCCSFHTMNITAENLPGVRLPMPLGYRDQWVFIPGVEFKLSERWKLSFGYNYGTAPVAPGHLLPEGSTCTQHHFSTGIRYERKNWWVGVGYILGFPASLHGTGWSAIPLGVDYGSSRVEHTLHSLVIGGGYSW
jgi:long-subunit fatty acid transport protein